MVDIIQHTEKKQQPIIEWEMGRIASMAALKKKRKRSWEILVNRTRKEYFLLGSFVGRHIVHYYVTGYKATLLPNYQPLLENFLLAMDIINDMNHFQLLHLKVQVVANK